MKTTIRFLSLSALLILGACGNPKQKFEVTVLDESGKPMAGVECKAWFHRHGKTSPLHSYAVTGLTGSSGTVALQGETLRYQTSVEASMPGYYDCNAADLWITGKKGERWQPWPVKLRLVMKKIRNPHPMYALACGPDYWFPFPEQNFRKACGFDLMEGDWVAPHGKGKVADFAIEGRTDKPDDSSRKPDGVVVLRFPNRGDGIRRMPDDPGYSELVGPAEAPLSGYETRYEFENARKKPDGGRSVDFSERVYVFRIRTKLDEKGRVTSAFYGKLHGIVFGRLNKKAPWIEMTYYLNGKPNQRSLEWDGETNLLKNLGQDKWPQRR